MSDYESDELEAESGSVEWQGEEEEAGDWGNEGGDEEFGDEEEVGDEFFQKDGDMEDDLEGGEEEEDFDYSDLEDEPANGEALNGVGSKAAAKKMEEEHGKAQSVRDSLGWWRQLIDAYSSEGKQLFTANKLPIGSTIGNFEQSSQVVKQELLSTKLGLVGLIQDLQTLRAKVSPHSTKNSFNNMFASLTKVDIKSTKRPGKDGKMEQILLSSKVNTDSIFNQLEKGFETRTKQYEEIASNWFTKTNLQSSSKDKNTLQKLNQLQMAPYKAAQSAIEESNKLLEKIRKKTGVYRILGESRDDQTVPTNEEIFEDPDLINDLARERLETKDLSEQTFTVTRSINPYDAQRKLRKEEKAVLGKRLTKDRAVKFLEHEKLVNFMTPTINTELAEGRDDIIQNLFGISKTSKVEESFESKPKKKLKRAHDEDDIQLY